MSGIVAVVNKVAQQVPMTNEAIRELQVEQQQVQRKVHDLERNNEQLMQTMSDNVIFTYNKACDQSCALDFHVCEVLNPRQQELQGKRQGELANIIMLEKPSIKWSDVAGLEMAKKSLKRAVNMVVRFSVVK
ncbi:hypothetical protein WR25_06059 [Diploscapter pachys]|uniref:Uncharacterized protein n=1 Tax=Diploscapter pachys TaxID=2018661 RepID=A0A2A2LNS6_9BILA|nr:hypothetical protein WR25_06059 [Diploscapter pachys]